MHLFFEFSYKYYFSIVNFYIERRLAIIYTLILYTLSNLKPCPSIVISHRNLEG